MEVRFKFAPRSRPPFFFTASSSIARPPNLRHPVNNAAVRPYHAVIVARNRTGRQGRGGGVKLALLEILRKSEAKTTRGRTSMIDDVYSQRQVMTSCLFLSCLSLTVADVPSSLCRATVTFIQSTTTSQTTPLSLSFSNSPSLSSTSTFPASDVLIVSMSILTHLNIAGVLYIRARNGIDRPTPEINPPSLALEGRARALRQTLSSSNQVAQKRKKDATKVEGMKKAKKGKRGEMSSRMAR